MPDELEQIEAKLTRFGARVRKGYQALHPPSEKHLSVVRETIKAQKGDAQKASTGAKLTDSQAQSKSPQSKSKGRSHHH